MRVGLIVYGLDRPITGIGRYTLELARALSSLPESIELFLLIAGKPNPPIDHIKAHQISLPGSRLLPGLLTIGSAILPSIIKQHKLDVIHDPAGVYPFLFGSGHASIVSTVHDVFAWSCPGYSSILDTLIYKQWLPRTLGKSQGKIITVSEQSRRDINRYLFVANERIRVIPQGIGPQYQVYSTERVQQTLKERFGIAWPYILYVGSLTERKNIARTLHAFAQIADEFPLLHLVVVGPRSWKQTPIERVIEECNIQDRVFLTGPVPEIDLPILYNGAKLFVFPSLYEGFGLPPLEAMACGTPVITSNVSSLPEVTGDAAILVDPYDVGEIARSIKRVLIDPNLAEEMRTKGLDQARKFDWEQTAKMTVQVYRQALESV